MDLLSGHAVRETDEGQYQAGSSQAALVLPQLWRAEGESWVEQVSCRGWSHLRRLLRQRRDSCEALHCNALHDSLPPLPTLYVSQRCPPWQPHPLSAHNAHRCGV